MKRTDTTRCTTFNLPPPNEATLTFSSNPPKISIAIPQGSQWRMPLHWHPGKVLDCITVKSLRGHLMVYQGSGRGGGSRTGSPGAVATTFKPGQRVAWHSAREVRGRRTCTEDWSVEFVVTDQNLYRNVSIDPHLFVSSRL